MLGWAEGQTFRRAEKNFPEELTSELKYVDQETTE